MLWNGLLYNSLNSLSCEKSLKLNPHNFNAWNNKGATF